MNYKKNKWDSLARNNEDNILRAVISEDDLLNYYFDKATKNVLEEVVKLKHDFKVLDYGCGVGRISLWMAPKVDSIVGLDISPKMIEIAKKPASEKNIKNLEFNVTNGKLINYRDEYFDLIICCITLKHIIDEDDLCVMLREFSRTVKSGGCIAIIDDVNQNGPEFRNDDGYQIAQILRPSEHYISLLESFNLEIVRECSLYFNFFNSKYMLFSSKIGINKFKKFDRTFRKFFMDLDLLFDKKVFKKFKTKTGLHLLYFKKTPL